NLGTVLKEQGRFDAAQACYRRVLELKPGFAEAHNNLGVVLKDLNRLEEAIASYKKAIELKPDYAEAYNNLGAALQTIGQLDAALDSFDRAAQIQPQDIQHAIYAQLMLPVIPESSESITKWRERYRNGIAVLMDSSGTLDEPGKLSGISFYLAYHNASDRPLMESLCSMFRKRVPELTYTAPHVERWRPLAERGQRIRVGFLSEFLFDHTIGKHYQGFIRHLDRSRFEVVVIHGTRSQNDSFRQNLDLLADKVCNLPSGLKKQQQAVAAERLDVLFYPDIGMAPSTYFLAYSRLAPVQATSWGHPDTSGLDTMDYYVSATGNEPDAADEYYSERLVRLNRLPCFYYRTPASSIPKLSKTELGLPESGALYGCLQNLFKIHPDFDAVLAAVAEGDPAGHLVFPEGRHSSWTELLKARWAKSFPLLNRQVVFLPRTSWDRFMATMSQMDVLLDPLHFGSGNTFYDAMVTGTPVVTWPGRYARGRNVAAAYRQMGVADAPVVADLKDYAPLALALGRDTERRRALQLASFDAAGRELFEDMRAVREFESFLDAAVAAAGRRERLPAGWRPDR
ncbi:MAG TPA: tetratricopeptide repeat protein, partial [Gallionella sp.]|nr:tetratricopeptide repeat protein [Gallionella sp.]